MDQNKPPIHNSGNCLYQSGSAEEVYGHVCVHICVYLYVYVSVCVYVYVSKSVYVYVYVYVYIKQVFDLSQ